MNTTCENLCQNVVEIVKAARIVLHYSELLEKYTNITKNDIHIIEAIGEKSDESMSSVAAMLCITVGSLSVAVNTLVKKGYVRRIRSEEDRRVVFLELTEKGLEVYRDNQKYHYYIMNSILNLYTEEQIQALSECGEILMNYLKEYN